MRENPDFIVIQKYVRDNNLTRQQVVNATQQQFKNLLGHSVSASFIRKVKQIIIGAFDEARDNNRLQEIKNAVKTYLDANFPNWTTERGQVVGEDGNEYQFVKIWLQGLPPSPDVLPA